MPDEDMPDRVAFEQRIIDRQNSPAGVAEDDFNAEILQRTQNGLGAIGDNAGSASIGKPGRSARINIVARADVLVDFGHA